jgi:hypothetical protein
LVVGWRVEDGVECKGPSRCFTHACTHAHTRTRAHTCAHVFCVSLVPVWVHACA